MRGFLSSLAKWLRARVARVVIWVHFRFSEIVTTGAIAGIAYGVSLINTAIGIIVGCVLVIVAVIDGRS